MWPCTGQRTKSNKSDSLSFTHRSMFPQWDIYIKSRSFRFHLPPNTHMLLALVTDTTASHWWSPSALIQKPYNQWKSILVSFLMISVTISETQPDSKVNMRIYKTWTKFERIYLHWRDQMSFSAGVWDHVCSIQELSDVFPPEYLVGWQKL